MPHAFGVLVAFSFGIRNYYSFLEVACRLSLWVKNNIIVQAKVACE